jgi:ribonuclease P protein component
LNSEIRSSVRETLFKGERLCSKKLITALFETGNVFHTPLFKVVWALTSLPSPFPAQVVFSVPKRGFKHAVTRNLIKRRLREAYRKNKNDLCEYLKSENKQVAFAVIVRGNSIPDYSASEASVKEMLNKLLFSLRQKS